MLALALGAHLICISTLRLCTKWPEKARQSTGVRIALIQPEGETQTQTQNRVNMRVQLNIVINTTNLEYKSHIEGSRIPIRGLTFAQKSY